MPLNHPITPALLADPEIFQQNRLPFHAHFADQTSPELSLTVSLDGEWNFRYAENLTAPFTDWDTLTVPGFIQMQSLQKPGQPYGTPHYVNTQYPWDGHEKLGKLLPASERRRQCRRRLVQRRLHRLHRGYLHSR